MTEKSEMTGSDGGADGADIVVSAAWLADRLEEPAVRVVDVRDAWEYDAMGHVPGAVNVPFDAFRDREGPDAGTLPGAAAFAELLGDAGIDRSDTIVAYDDTNGVFAARFLVTALVYGFEDVHLLNGDFSAWKHGHPVDGDPVERDPVTVEPRRVDGPELPILEHDAVVELLESPADVVFLDTRDAEEYAAGHLPGAVRFDWTEAVDPDTRGFRSPDDLRKRFAERGITPDRPVVLYCNTARRLSHTYVALRWIGVDDVHIYEGSLTEWRERGRDLVTEE
ncbi:sulfurtransferase [Halopenitus sp. POP-27]|uniref:sulfurtransferase n=1 Tax=Halopenitus sp. POP-27 TaxID=2994425 RepID=UPI0024687910|nr:sulfurtransferase [Halopenitus sp. POP-27]